MNTLLLNRDGFQMPADGWYQVAPLGEFAHAGAGVVQVVDAEACAAMVNRFAAEAAGWITALEARCPRSEVGDPRSEAEGPKADVGNRTSDVGLWAQIRWSDVGEEAVRGRRYRFLSPVWARGDCQDLGGRRVRPVRLLNAAVTNDPNLKGMRPLSNSRGQRSEVRDQGREIGDPRSEIRNPRPVRRWDGRAVGLVRRPKGVLSVRSDTWAGGRKYQRKTSGFKPVVLIQFHFGVHSITAPRVGSSGWNRSSSGFGSGMACSASGNTTKTQ